ncbi:hypothetical protein HDU98_005946 [Podochytrium sp. JEL0797]|nr:hypothetical protein HDU98_005946 [Podochytrium sp. JEL0797]
MPSFKTTILAAVAAFASAQSCQSGSAGATCLTSGGSWLEIIAPFANSSAAVGQPMTITWTVCGTDPNFLTGNITFSIVDASNSANAQSIPNGQLNTVGVGAGTTSVTIPNLPSTGKYAVSSSYHDATANKWDSCFGNTFSVTGGVVAPTGGATATVATTKSAAGAVVIGSVAAMVAAALAL